MSTQVNPRTNTSNLMRVGAEFNFSDGASSLSDALQKGYTPVGNIVGVTPNFSTTVVDHFSSERGGVRKDRSDLTKKQIEFDVKVDEFNQANLRSMFGADASIATTGWSQGALSSQAMAPWVFSSGNKSVIGNWYSIKTTGGVTVRLPPGTTAGVGVGTTTVTIGGASLTEGTDYELDLVLGRIRFLTVQQTTLTATISTSQAIAVTDQGAFFGLAPLAVGRRTGFGQLTFFDQDSGNPVPIDYKDFSCQVTLKSVSELNPDKFCEMILTVLITETVGVVYGRYANTH